MGSFLPGAALGFVAVLAGVIIGASVQSVPKREDLTLGKRCDWEGCKNPASAAIFAPVGSMRVCGHHLSLYTLSNQL